MKKVILQSMTDFVELQEETPTFDTPQIDWYDKEIDKLYKIRKYSKFLTQKLELWMFVPCKLVDGVWVVLKEPLKRDYNNVNINNSYFKEYQEAKERVLFEGWKVIEKTKSYILITDRLNELSFVNNGSVLRKVSIKKDSFVRVSCLEDFFNNLLYSKNDDLYVKKEIILTPTAQKQIGLRDN